MPLQARPDELRLALVALVAAASDPPDARERCADLMDDAANAARRAPTEVLQTIDAPATARVGALLVLSELCASCGGCPRGLMSSRLRR
jgi:hypothetical protein